MVDSFPHLGILLLTGAAGLGVATDALLQPENRRQPYVVTVGLSLTLACLVLALRWELNDHAPLWVWLVSTSISPLSLVGLCLYRAAERRAEVRSRYWQGCFLLGTVTSLLVAASWVLQLTGSID